MTAAVEHRRGFVAHQLATATSASACARRRRSDGSAGHRAVAHGAAASAISSSTRATQVARVGQRAAFEIQRPGDVCPAGVDLTHQVGHRHPHVTEECPRWCDSPTTRTAGESSTPGLSIGTTMTEIPRCRGASGSVRTHSHSWVDTLGAAVPDLRAVDHPLVAVADRAGAQAGQIGTGLRLGVPDARRRSRPWRSAVAIPSCSVRCRAA